MNVPHVWPNESQIRGQKHLKLVNLALETPMPVRAAIKSVDRPREDSTPEALHSFQSRLTWAAGMPWATAILA